MKLISLVSAVALLQISRALSADDRPSVPLDGASFLQTPLSLGTANPPTVRLDKATVVGTLNGSVESYLGIPFAHPPVGKHRLQQPQLLSSYNGTINATTFGDQCLTQVLNIPPNLPPDIQKGIVPFEGLFASNPNVPHSEDCLYLNIIRPANTPSDAKFPVLVYIYGGGFSGGSNAVLSYNGANVVQGSMDIKQPIIYVAINYRTNVFGFLGGKEVKQAGLGNLGLQDQRAALRWINKYISAFGGDPTKVTISGESAGAVSVALQMFANNGDTEGLFRAAIMISGSLQSTGDITELQNVYDFIVGQVGCSGSYDTLACLRTVPAENLLGAVNKTPNVLDYPGLANDYAPRADGSFVTAPPFHLPQQGKMAKIPFIIGNDKDEGTLWSIGSLNVTTDAEFASYISQNWFRGASTADLSQVLKLYPSNPAAGSPFDTGSANAFTPENKRISALQGDLFFFAPGRQLLDTFSSSQAAYNYLYVRDAVPGLGFSHGSELFNFFGPGDVTSYFVRFVSTLDPNGAGAVWWPRFNTSARATLQFNDGKVPVNVTRDSARLAGTDAVTNLSMKFPF